MMTMNPNTVKIVVRYHNREEAVYVKDLRELAAWIDDFATDHCEGTCQLYMKLDGLNQYDKVDIYCEVY